MMIEKIIERVRENGRLSFEDACALFRTNEIHRLGSIANSVTERRNGKKVYFVRNRHINPTNICVNRCRFCAFSRSRGEKGAYELTVDEILDRIETSRPELSEVHIVGGLHPEWPFEYYLEMISAIKERFPSIHVKAFTAVEVDYFSRISGLNLMDTLESLKARGLETMPGGGAEIFSEKIRKKICPEKISGDRWLEIHRTAHQVGIRTNATMLYGHIESFEDRIDHMLRLRELQDDTGGFQAFIPLSYHPKNTEIGGQFPSGLDDLRTIAISRLMLDNVPHIKAYWVMLGQKLSQVALLFGADDIDGTVIEEKITHSAGATTSEGLTMEQIIHFIRRAGKLPVERDSFYEVMNIFA
jgi:aminodeoxyfutalosine synthase